MPMDRILCFLLPRHKRIMSSNYNATLAPHEQEHRPFFNATVRSSPRDGVFSRPGHRHPETEVNQATVVSTLVRSQARLPKSPNVLDVMDLPVEAGSGALRDDEEAPGLTGVTGLSCKMCGTPTNNICKGCEAVGYCSLEHQKEDWQRHAQECRGKNRSNSAQTAKSEDLQVYGTHPDPVERIPATTNNNNIYMFTPGNVFQVDAILLPADKPLPELVKATFEVAINAENTKMIHREKCFTELLGPAASWISDAQWDEDTHQLPTARKSSDDFRTHARFSLHCRPNGKVNACYAALVQPEALRPSALRPTPRWGAIDNKLAHCHGNGNFLILRHPPGICCPEVPGMFVEDATLDDVEKVISYLEQRRHFMATTGGAKYKMSCCGPAAR